MIIVHKGIIFFDLLLLNPFPVLIDKNSLIIEEEVILPLNISYLNVIKSKELKTENLQQLSSDLEVVALGISSSEELYLYARNNEKDYKLLIPNNCSFIYNDSSKYAETIFKYNVKNYFHNDFTVSDILYDLSRKTVFIERPSSAYTISIKKTSF